MMGEEQYKKSRRQMVEEIYEWMVEQNIQYSAVEKQNQLRDFKKKFLARSEG